MKTQTLKTGLTLLLMSIPFIANTALFADTQAGQNLKVNNSEKILLERTHHTFTDTLEIAKNVLQKNGFKVAHVQRCDGGLTHMGYQTDKYRVVFFGRLNEVRELSKTHTELVPFFPFKLLIYAEGDQSIISILNPQNLNSMVKDKALLSRIEKWKQEFVQVLKQIKDS